MSLPTTEHKKEYNKVLDSCIRKIRATAIELQDDFPRFPHSASGGTWSTSGEEEWKKLIDGYWTGGFWVGMLFLAYKLTGEKDFLDWGRKWFAELSPRAKKEGIHDLGFLFFPSAALGAELTDDIELAGTAMEAAAGLFGCYSPFYRCMTIFRREPLDRVIAIDTMMNLPLLWWAAQSTNNQILEKAARNHVDTTIEHLVRSDGSTCHIGDFHIDKREMMKIETWQGRAPDSAWARGQAWAVSGLAYAYFFTGEPNYKQQLDLTLTYFSDHLPDDNIPLWDLDITERAKYEWQKEPRDSSALAIVTHALLMLDEEKYISHADKWLRALIGNCLVPESEPGLIAHVCFHKPAKIDVDCSCVFADFYFLFALALASGRLEFSFHT